MTPGIIIISLSLAIAVLFVVAQLHDLSKRVAKLEDRAGEE